MMLPHQNGREVTVMVKTVGRKRSAQFKLSLEPELFAKIKRSAERRDVTINTEIVERLQSTIGTRVVLYSSDLGNLILQLSARINALEQKYGEGAYAAGVMPTKGGE
jgi:hypothetical protein